MNNFEEPQPQSLMEFSFKYFATLIFDSFSTKVCLGFHRCFFRQKMTFLVEHIY